jgi:hypothetical protein
MIPLRLCKGLRVDNKSVADGGLGVLGHYHLLRIIHEYVRTPLHCMLSVQLSFCASMYSNK